MNGQEVGRRFPMSFPVGKVYKADTQGGIGLNLMGKLECHISDITSCASSGVDLTPLEI
jgi:hypothetical protein